MKRLIIVAVAAFFILGVTLVAFAEEQGTKQEAKALVDNALTYIKANGKVKALAEFNNPKGSFVAKDMYIFALDMNGVFLAHGGNPKMAGKNQMKLQDADGKYLVKGLIIKAKSGGGWYDYKWANPLTKKIQDKSTYVMKVDDYLIGCGIYK
ncbi:MAG TPA: cache domain-containing protein [Desulfuromonadaceae bacterium]|jgi:signal transduction histidine kinase